jgi:N6-L-threonylcarbamoyladenine synthase
MRILGIETSCDETSAAVVEGTGNTLILKSNIVASSLAMHIPTGGIIPENAAREQLKYILPVINEALQKAEVTLEDIDAIAVTYGPGLIGSLLVGVETAKTIATVLNKPLIPVNHMVGHIYANFINTSLRGSNNEAIPQVTVKRTGLPRSVVARNDEIAFPLLALVVSGGHTDMLYMKEHSHFELLGGTRDDAAGEALDKIGRLIDVAYPAGPVIEKLSKEGDPKRFRFPRPLIGSPDYDFSFSGLKTAVLREVKMLGTLDEQTRKDIARGTLDAIIDVIVKKTLKAAVEKQIKTIILSGGVAANQTMRDAFVQEIKKRRLDITFSVPPRSLCTDNAAMIAAAAYFNDPKVTITAVNANPELYFD